MRNHAPKSSHSRLPQAIKMTQRRFHRRLSRGRAFDVESDNAEISFVHAPGSWTDAALRTGERAFVLLKKINGVIYERYGKGHLLVEIFDSESFVILPISAQKLSEVCGLSAYAYPGDATRSILPLRQAVELILTQTSAARKSRRFA